MSLQIKMDAHKKSLPISFNDLQAQLPGLKKEIEWLKDVPSGSLQYAVQKLKISYDNFFSGRANHPKYKSKKDSNSILLKYGEQVSKTEFKLPKLGVLKVFKDRTLNGKFKTATIVKTNNDYFLHVAFENRNKTIEPCDNQIGVDVGISNFAVLSDGSFIEHPKLSFKYKNELQKHQRKLSRCKLRGKNWHKQLLKVKKVYQKITRSRLDFLHKSSAAIVKNNGFISVEKLNIKGMIKSNLSKYIADSGWGIFKQLLKYKSELHSRVFIEVQPHYLSQKCFKCGCIERDNRKSQSIFICVKCGHKDNADLNASKNILRRGQCLLAQSTDK